MTILLADDSQFMRTILRDIVTGVFSDVEVVEAGNGEEAITIINDKQPDLILLDLIMPRKGGIDVLTDMKGKMQGKVVIISAMGQEKIIEEAKSLGAQDFIVKPFDERKVAEIIQRVLGKS